MSKRTEEKLSEMLKENTGRHFLDSGGAYGRNWERNQSREFESEPAAKVTFEICTWGDDKKPHLETNVVFNVYHWLKGRLTWDEDLGKVMRVAARFIRAANWRAGKREHDYVNVGEMGTYKYEWQEHNGELPTDFELAQEIPVFFAAWKARRDEADRDECRDCEGTGEMDCDQCEEHRCDTCKGRGWVRTASLRFDQKKGFVFDHDDYEPKEVYTTNTYNHECSLDQTLQFITFTVDRQEYCVLQIHGGCDVRGGYTDPVLFEVTGEEYCMHEFSRVTMYCTKEYPYPQPIPSLTVDVGDDEPESPHVWDSDNDGHDWNPANREMDLQFDDRRHWKKSIDLVIIDEDKFEELRREMGAQWERMGGNLPTITDGDGLTYARTWQKGKFCVIGDKKQGLCPHCGGVLQVAPWP